MSRIIRYYLFSILVTLTGCTSLDTRILKLTDGTTVKELTLNNGTVSVSVIPALGGKVTSISTSGGSNILSRSNRPYVRRRYGMPFNETEFDGIDEIFPTMIPCNYPAPPWRKIKIPDHGELFSQPWKQVKGKGIALAVTGKILPYFFKREISVEGNKIIFDYTLTNIGKDKLHYFYMFHPLFKGENDVALSIPSDDIVLIGPNKKAFMGKPRKSSRWGELPFGGSLFTKNSKRYWKIINPGPSSDNIVIKYKHGEYLKLSWDKTNIPYYAVWCSEGILNGLNHIAPEPMTSPFESLAKAFAEKSSRVIVPGRTVTWRIVVSL